MFIFNKEKKQIKELEKELEEIKNQKFLVESKRDEELKLLEKYILTESIFAELTNGKIPTFKNLISNYGNLEHDFYSKQEESRILENKIKLLEETKIEKEKAIEAKNDKEIIEVKVLLEAEKAKIALCKETITEYKKVIDDLIKQI